MRRPRANEIKPDARQFSGMINAEKCIAYLRGIGVEVDDATADAWLDSQAVQRFLRRMKRPVLVVWLWSCSCGEMEGFGLEGEKAPRPRKRRDMKDTPRERDVCESCGGGLCHASRWYEVARDGTETDYRHPTLERITPFNWRELLEEFRD